MTVSKMFKLQRQNCNVQIESPSYINLAYLHISITQKHSLMLVQHDRFSFTGTRRTRTWEHTIRQLDTRHCEARYICQWIYAESGWLWSLHYGNTLWGWFSLPKLYKASHNIALAKILGSNRLLIMLYR